VTLALQAQRDMVAALTDDAPRTLAAFDHAITVAQMLEDPVFAGVATPAGRLKVEVLQQSVEKARVVAVEELGAALGVGLGFNALDGD
jgi:predicted lipoprotein